MPDAPFMRSHRMGGAIARKRDPLPASRVYAHTKHMCYSMHMATPAKPERANSRTVVLLRDSDRRKLEKLAAREKVSSGEIIRRSLDSYKTLEARIRKEEEEKMMESTPPYSSTRSKAQTARSRTPASGSTNCTSNSIRQKPNEPRRQLHERRQTDSPGDRKHQAPRRKGKPPRRRRLRHRPPLIRIETFVEVTQRPPRRRSLPLRKRLIHPLNTVILSSEEPRIIPGAPKPLRTRYCFSSIYVETLPVCLLSATVSCSSHPPKR